MDYKKAFYSKLEDCYLGAKIKQANKDKSANKSGFTNLLDIKEKYFNYVKNYLEQRIDFQNSEDASEIYNKLFTFFDSYLNETGTPFFIDTPIYKNIYAKIYSNSKDTNLFYKTQNLYYVKSDIIFESLTLSDSKGKYNFYFDASEFKQNSDNNKSKTFFKLHSIGFDENDIKQITIKVSNQKDLFPKLSNIFKQNSNEFNEEFLKALDNNKIKINEEELKKIFRSYRKQNEIDFFIHKNAKAFLEEQFDLWMFNHLYKDSQIQQWNPNAIKRMQEVRNIAYEIIYFIAKFEDELKAIWLKPKFAKNTEYVFSLDIIINKAKDSKKLLDLIFKDKNFKNQIKEWKELNLIDENFNISLLQGKTEEIEKYKFIPIDTKHLSREVKFELLSSFDNLEELLNGELIKSDNFQALNSIMPKYQGKIDLIYIDPPFNLGENASFDYKVNFKDSTWASLLDSRFELARQILSDKGSIFVRCDYNGNFIVRSLLNNIFGVDNFINEIVISKSAKLTETIKKYHSGSDSLFFFVKTNNYIFNVQGIQRKERQWRSMHLPGERWSPIPNQYIHLFSKNNLVKKNNKYASKARIILGVELSPPNGRHWALSQKTIFELEKRGEIRLVNGIPKTQESNIKKLTSNWTDWVGYSSDWGFQTENHEKVLQRVILTGSNIDSTILDYHLGSGTTCAVALKLGRKFLGVEMGEHFYKVVIPRLKKVIAGFQSGISKETEYKGGGAFRYYELESYEEALANCEYVLKIGNDKKINSIPYNINDYYNENIDFYEGIIDYRKSRKLIKKLNKAENKPITINMSAEYREEFDIFQTIANIMNLKIKRLFLDKNGVESCEYDNGDITNINNICLYKYKKLKTLIFWNKE